MILELLAILGGIVLLLWSADKFVEGSASIAKFYNIPSLIIGMVIIGFGTSAPELIVSSLAALQGNSGLALGNAYGSNITNIALILGLCSVIKPIDVHSGVLKKELPVLLISTIMVFFLIKDGELNRLDATFMVVTFLLLLGWSIWEGTKSKNDAFGMEVEQELKDQIKLGPSIFWTILGLTLLIVSSRFLVWGAVGIAKYFGVNDLLIGLTVVAIGTSLPELASSIVAAKKGEHDLALGNIIGSNLFNTLLVVGISVFIKPIKVPLEIINRDFPVMIGVTILLFLFGFGFKGQGRINRIEGSVFLLIFVAYTIYLILSV